MSQAHTVLTVDEAAREPFTGEGTATPPRNPPRTTPHRHTPANKKPKAPAPITQSPEARLGGLQSEEDLPEFSAAPTNKPKVPDPKYQPKFLGFMEYQTGKKFGKDTTFTPNYLKGTQEYHVEEYLNVKLYGKKKPNYKRDNPKLRSSHMKAIKSAISHYMPLQHVPWDGW